MPKNRRIFEENFSPNMGKDIELKNFSPKIGGDTEGDDFVVFKYNPTLHPPHSWGGKISKF